MSELPNCPECGSEYTYQDRDLFVCPECAYEWQDGDGVEKEDEFIVRDSLGNILSNGDTVTVIKDLKVRGTSSVIKVGTKVKNIRLVQGGDHEIDAKIPGMGAMMIMSSKVKKS